PAALVSYTSLFHDTAAHRLLHSFPTRRSSDLAEIARDVVDAVQGLEEIARQHHILDQLGHVTVADHLTVGRGERKVLEQGLAPERTAGVHPELDVPDQILERAPAVSDVRVRHP